MILFVNACARSDSRTIMLANILLGKLDEPFEEIRLIEYDFPVTDEAFLKKRDHLIRINAFNDSIFNLASQFAAADKIIIAAPYYDLSFPACVKQYFEQINVLGITFRYTPEGYPEGLCQAEKLYYVTTAGGMFVPDEYGFGYVKALSENFYGIKDVKLIRAIGLDIYGADPKKILKECADNIRDDPDI